VTTSASALLRKCTGPMKRTPARVELRHALDFFFQRLRAFDAQPALKLSRSRSAARVAIDTSPLERAQKLAI